MPGAAGHQHGQRTVNGRPAVKDGSVSGPCQLGECGFCHGNIDIQAGPGRPVPMLTCSCTCHRGKPARVRKV